MIKAFVLSLKQKAQERRQDETGIALVELMAAIGVLTIVLLLSAAALIQGLDIQNKNNQYNQAVQIAKIEIERARGLSYDKVALVYEGPATANVPYGDTRQVVTMPKPEGNTSNLLFRVKYAGMATSTGSEEVPYNVETLVMGRPDSRGCYPVKEIIVKVSWVETNGDNRQTGLNYIREADLATCIPSIVPTS